MNESVSVLDRAAARPRVNLAPWVPALTMMLVSLISYIDRNTLALLAPTIHREMQLSAQQYGFVVSAFSVAYMVGNRSSCFPGLKRLAQDSYN